MALTTFVAGNVLEADQLNDSYAFVTNFNTRQVITATNATWPVPTLKNPIVRVIVTGGGGGGGGGRGGGTGGTGGTTTFASGEAFAVAATGGTGGYAGGSNLAGRNGTAGFSAGNHASGGDAPQNVDYSSGHSGQGGEVKVAYCDLTGKSTLNLIIGAGGTAGTAGVGPAGGTGGRGEITVEYVA
jgi:hypothetical protein